MAASKDTLKDLLYFRYLSYLHYREAIQFLLGNLDQLHTNPNTVIPFLACWLKGIRSPVASQREVWVSDSSECGMFVVEWKSVVCPPHSGTRISKPTEGHRNRKQNLASDSSEMMVNDTIPIYIPNSWTHKSYLKKEHSHVLDVE